MMAADPKKQLSLLDSTCIIVGIIIGAGIYQMTPDIAKGASSGWGLLLLWLAGGLISLCGALGYAELAAAYPFQGGDYIYLSRAYGRWAGFLFGWLQVVIVKPGDIAVMAFAFAAYARVIYDPFAGITVSYDFIPWKSYAGLVVPAGQLLYAGGAVAVLTALNILGVREGKWTQNLLTLVKALGLLFIVGAALLSPVPSEVTAPDFTPLPPSLALIFVLFTFGGWNEIAYVAAEVKNPRRNMVRALVLGLLSVTVLYLLVNGAFLYSLGYRGIAASGAVAADSIAAAFPRRGGQIISALICLSALGAVSGLIFTGARVSYALGTGHRVFSVLGRWNARSGVPVRAFQRPKTLKCPDGNPAPCSCPAGNHGHRLDCGSGFLCQHHPLYRRGRLYLLSGHQYIRYPVAPQRAADRTSLPGNGLSASHPRILCRLCLAYLQLRIVCHRL